MRGKTRPRFVIVAFALLVITAVAGCSTPHKEIDAIGVVAAVEWTPAGNSGVYKVTFDDGRTYEMQGGPQTGLGPSPNAGDLLIAGSKPSNWMLVAPLRKISDMPVPCYGLVENGEERDTTIELDFGVTLQKAPDFDEGGRNPKFSTRITGGVICLNREGQVRKIY